MTRRQEACGEEGVAVRHARDDADEENGGINDDHNDNDGAGNDDII